MDEEPPDVSGSEPVSDHQTLRRAARALLGWLPDEQGLRLLNGSRGDVAPTEGQRQLVAAAHAAVASRPAGEGQGDVIRAVNAGEFDAHIESLRAAPGAAVHWAEGHNVAWVNLRNVYGFQPTVFLDSARERLDGIDLTNRRSLAEVTLPLGAPTSLPIQADEAHHVFTTISRNPNLRVTGQFIAQVGDGPGLGFSVSISPSYLVVASYQGRHYLRDGYHRALGLLLAGVSEVPAFVRSYDSIQSLVPPGMLPHEAFLGERPPRLTDYLDDSVSVDVELPATQKMIVVQALELATAG